ncbi:ADP-ribosyl-[dinitrogen reductase] glycohydrolase [bacterium HR18]|uniref:ADP-ribosylglycohydrolase family protein n=1 Tax=Rhodothermus marinus TaxID=29549 RepID=A0A7V2AZJ5_RHOMR|nr:ADP-ribosyl-[dinitrogen reductase] glycohydrolase [bacterium HR18]
MTADRMLGALLGTAIGDALGMPVEGLSHDNVRRYYRGIKQYEPDRYRGDLQAGQWTDDTQFTFTLVHVLTEWLEANEHPKRFDAALGERLAAAYVAQLPQARRWGPTSRAAVARLMQGAAWNASGDACQPTNGAAMRAAPLGLWWAATGASPQEALAFIYPILAITHRHPTALVAGFGQAFAVAEVLRTPPNAFATHLFWQHLLQLTTWAESALGDVSAACSRRLRLLQPHLHDVPLDLQDLCNGTGTQADESWPFAVAMFVRNPDLIEATLLSAINVGGDTDTIGAMVGALLGARHGWSAFPESWRRGLEASELLETEARALIQRLLPFLS